VISVVIMTLEEALQRIHEAGRCFVIFDADTGEVLEVQESDAADAPDALLGTMGAASKVHGSVKGRFFDGAEVTLETLEHEVEESRCAAGRVAVFSRWSVLPPGELVRVLETDDFAPPMDTFHGPRHVIERIFDYSPDILLPFVRRLERIAQRTSVEQGLEAPVRLVLESKLAVLAGDFARLKTVWERHHPGTFSSLVWHPELLECIGDLRPRDPEPIEILIQTVSYPKPMMFGPRCEALRSLGKVGGPAGPRAARGIRDMIYDSTPSIMDLRECVLARIETPESEWEGCPRCYWGRVPGRPWQDDDYCAACLGLGFVR